VGWESPQRSEPIAAVFRMPVRAGSACGGGCAWWGRCGRQWCGVRVARVSGGVRSPAACAQQCVCVRKMRNVVRQCNAPAGVRGSKNAGEVRRGNRVRVCGGACGARGVRQVCGVRAPVKLFDRLLSDARPSWRSARSWRWICQQHIEARKRACARWCVTAATARSVCGAKRQAPPTRRKRVRAPCGRKRT